MKKNRLPGRKLFEMSEVEIYNYFNQFPNQPWSYNQSFSNTFLTQSFSDTFLLSGTNIKQRRIKKKGCIDCSLTIFMSTVSVNLFNGIKYMSLIFGRTDTKLKKIYYSYAAK